MCPVQNIASVDNSITVGIEEYERQFREILEHCPAGLNVVDEDGRLLVHETLSEKAGHGCVERFFVVVELHRVVLMSFRHDIRVRFYVCPPLHGKRMTLFDRRTSGRDLILRARCIR